MEQIQKWVWIKEEFEVLRGNQNLYIEEQITQSAKRKSTKGQPMTYKTYT
jgi:hypothetical protein